MAASGQALEHAFVVTVGPGRLLLGAFLDVSGIGLDYEVHEHAEGGNNLFVHKLRGRLRQQNLTLKSGLTDQDLLLDWVLGRGDLFGPQDIHLAFTNADGTALRAFGFHAAIPIRWTGPQANIAANAVATETLELAHCGLIPL
jgi:phage tail-like protein